MNRRTIVPRLAVTLLATVATLLTASAAGAATQGWRTTTVDLPDGSQVEIDYAGDIAPKVRVSMPVVQETEPVLVEDRRDDVAYGGIPRARRVIQPPQPGYVSEAPVAQVPQPAAPQFVVAGDATKGSTYEYTLITTGADGRVCSQSTEWTSRGRGQDPAIKRTDRGEGCAAMNGFAAPQPVPVQQPAMAVPRAIPQALPRSVPQALSQVAPQSLPMAVRAPVVGPVSVPLPVPMPVPALPQAPRSGPWIEPIVPVANY